jgi:hypothetical protein
MAECGADLLHGSCHASRLTPCGLAQDESASKPDGTIRVALIADVYGRRTDGTFSADAAGKKRLMTDGCGLISLNLAKRIPPIKGGRIVGSADSAARGAPLSCQCRLWHEGWVFKMVLLVDATLPDDHLVLPGA